jgi:mannose-1-phosphate guanylyltransferase
VESFVEKPAPARARRLFTERRWLWNSGLFVWKASSIMAALERCRPGLARAARRASPSKTAGPWRISERAMSRIESAPIDTAVLERTDNLYVVRASFDWSDLGNWNALADRLPADRHGNRSIGRVIAIDSSRCVTIGPGGLTTLVGVRNLVVAQDKGVVLVCARDTIAKLRDAQRLLRGVLAAYA